MIKLLLRAPGRDFVTKSISWYCHKKSDWKPRGYFSGSMFKFIGLQEKKRRDGVTMIDAINYIDGPEVETAR